MENSAELKFLKVKISAKLNCTESAFEVTGLCDGGCTSIVLSAECMRAARVTDKYSITTSDETRLRTAMLDSSSTVLGFTSCYITLTDSENKQHPFYCRVYISSGLRHSLYVGSNLLQSPRFSKQTKRGLYFTNIDDHKGNPTKKNKKVFIPFLKSVGNKDITLRANNFSIIPAMSTTAVPIKPLHDTDPAFTHFVPHDIKSNRARDVEVMAREVDKSEESLSIIMSNNSTEDVTISPNDEIAKATLISPVSINSTVIACDVTFDEGIVDITTQEVLIDAFDINNITVNERNNPIEISALRHYPAKDAVTEKDLQKEIRDSIRKKGFAQLTASDAYKHIEEKGEFSPEHHETVHTATELLHMLDTKHLTESQKQQLLPLIERYKSVFATDLNSIKKTHLCVLGATLRKGADLEAMRCKHTPTPYHLKKELTKIIRQMLRAGLVNVNPKTVRLITPVRIIKKSSGGYRLIQDARITNAVIQSPPTDSHNESIFNKLSSLGRASVISQCDMKSSFWQIGVTEYFSSLLCFAAPDRQLYQATCVPMGALTSMMCLNHTVGLMLNIPCFDKEFPDLNSQHNYNFQEKLTDAQIQEVLCPVQTQVLGVLTNDNKQTPPERETVYHTELTAEQLKDALPIRTQTGTIVINYADDLCLSSDPPPEPCCGLQPERKDKPAEVITIPINREEALRQPNTNNNDLSISDNEFKHHLAEFEILLMKLQKASLKISPHKTTIASKTLQVLGLIWSPGVISIAQAKMTALKELPNPRTKRQALSMLCSLAYYRAFVPKFSDLTRCIREAIKQPTYKWTSEQETAKNDIISSLTDSSSLSLYHPNKPLILSTDASIHSAAGALDQIDDDNRLLPIANFSRTFTKSEMRMSIFKKELMALMYGLTAYDHLIQGSPNKLHIICDSRALTFMRYARDGDPIIFRMSQAISSYGIASITSVASALNIPSDQFSRMHPSEKALATELDGQAPMSQTEAEIFARNIRVENGKVFKGEELKMLLKGSSPQSTIAKKKKTSKQQGTSAAIAKPRCLTRRSITPPALEDRSTICRNSPWKTSKMQKQKESQLRRELKQTEQRKMTIQRQLFAMTNPRRNKKNNQVIECQELAAQEDDISENIRGLTEMPKVTGKVVRFNPRVEIKPIPIDSKNGDREEEEDGFLELYCIMQNSWDEHGIHLNAATVTVTDGISDETERIEDITSRKKHRTKKKSADTGNKVKKTAQRKSGTEQPPDVTTRRGPTNTPEDIDPTQFDKLVDTAKSHDDWIEMNADDSQEQHDTEMTDDESDSEQAPTFNFMSFISKTISDGAITTKSFAQEQRNDPVLAQIIDDIKTNNNQSTSYFLHDEMLFRKMRTRHVIAVPSHVLDTLVRCHHYSLIDGHASKHSSYKSLSHNFHHVRLKEKITEVADGCLICQTQRTRPENSEYMHGSQYSETESLKCRARASYQIDLFHITSQDQVKSDINYVLIAVELRSQYCVLLPLPSKSEQDIYSAILILFKFFGIPSLLRSDSESALRSRYVREKLAPLKVHLSFGSSTQSSSQGLVERRVGLAKGIIRTLRASLPDLTINEQLTFAGISLNSRFNKQGISPEQIMFGSIAGNPTNLLRITEQPPHDNDAAAATYAKHIENTLAARKQNMDKARERHNMNKRIPEYEPGTLVFVSQQKLIKKGTGLIARYKGPFIVLSKNTAGFSYILKDMKNNTILKRHVSRLLPCRSPLVRAYLSPSWTNQIVQHKQNVPKNVVDQVDHEKDT